MPRKIEDRRRMGPTEDEIVGWNHLLSGHEFEQSQIVKDSEVWCAAVHGVTKSQI